MTSGNKENGPFLRAFFFISAGSAVTVATPMLPKQSQLNWRYPHRQNANILTQTLTQPTKLNTNLEGAF
jgi:hypothetical protein